MAREARHFVDEAVFITFSANFKRLRPVPPLAISEMERQTMD